MHKHEYQSDFARKYFAEGREEGREEGQLDALRAAAARLLVAKLGSMPPDLSDRLASLREVARLERLVVELGMAQDPEAARAAFERIRGGAPTPGSGA